MAGRNDAIVDLQHVEEAGEEQQPDCDAEQSDQHERPDHRAPCGL